MARKASRKQGAGATPSRSGPCPVVAIGASAGGLEVFQQFFERMPGDTGMSFVLLQHLDPQHDTLMPELLSKHTSMAVCRVEDGLKVEPNSVYVIGPKMLLGFEACGLRVSPLKPQGNRNLIDHFFRSLALEQGENVVGIILSGTGTDGTVGLRAIKEHGGLTIAQNPEAAKFAGMPRSAISTGCVDLVLPVEEMAERVVEYAKHVEAMRHRKGAAVIQQEVMDYLPKIFPILRKQTSHDFSRYKKSTLVRRIQRRMQVAYVDSASKYVRQLEENPAEAEALFKDLLIGVTQFFRDPKDFEALEKKVLPALFEGKGEGEAVRVWVPGCASGEEAYSFAILLAEQAKRMERAPRIQVFATDLDDEALTIARKARYSADIEEDLTPERLARYFRRSGNGYEVVEELRELVIFSPHNLVKDPPFSRLDLLSCRNVLIYLEADLQKKLMRLFHYALNPSGYLFLGPSENIGSRSEFFRPVEPKHRIFQRKPTMLPVTPRAPLLDAGQVTRLQMPLASAPPMAQKEHTLARSIERVILEDYAPASAIINNQGEVVYFSGNTGKYLEPPTGVPNNKLVAMARKSLRLELRSALHRAFSTGKEAVRENIRFKIGREMRQIDLVVRPLPELGNEPELFIVLFRELIPSRDRGRPAIGEPEMDHPVIQQLEAELRTTREDLQTTIEELETSNEELKSANEELLSMNEELQSANEELQTSKEEVQSANEELNRKIEEAEAAAAELRRAHEDRGRLAAIVENSQDAIIGKTLDGIVTSWNKAAERIFGYAAEEMLGQSITKIIPRERLDEENYILDRLRRGERIEHYETERITKQGRRLFVSLMSSPIRDPQGVVIGASKIARDITERKQSEEARLLLASVIDSSDDAIITKSLEGIITSWNKAAERIYGYTAQEAIGKPVTVLMPPERQNEEPAIIERLKRGEKIDHYETVRRRKDGTLIDISLTVSPIKDRTGKIIGASKIARDITQRKVSEEARSRLAAVVDSSDDAIVAKTLNGIVTTWNKGAERIFGYTAQEMIGKSITTVFPPDRLAEEERVLATIRRGERLEHFETVRKRKDGRLIDVSLTISPIRDEFGRIIGASKIARDITERKQAEESRARLAAVVESSDDAIISKTLDGIVTSWNKGAEKIFGYTAEEMIGKHITTIFPAERLEEEARVIAHIRRGEPLEHFETVRKTKDGRLLDISLTVSPIRDPLGRIIGASKIARDITEQKKAERATRITAERLHLAFATGGMGDWDWDAKTDLVRLSDRAADIFGLPRGHSITWGRMRENLHEDDRERARLAVEEALAEHSLYNIEYRVHRPDGVLSWVLARGRGTYSDGGSVAGMIGVVQDVTERRRTEEALRLNESRLRFFIEHAPAALAMFDRDMRYQAVSRRWLEDYKLEGELVGRSHYEVFPDVPERWREIHQRGMRGEVLSAEEEPFVRANGTTQWIKWEVRPWFEGNQRIGGILIAAEDVTGRVKAKQALLKSEEQLRLMANTIPQLAWMAEPDGQIFWYNQRWYEYTGTTVEEMRGWGWQSVHDPVMLPAVLERWRQSLSTGEPFEMEFPLRGADGVFRWFLTRVSPMRDTAGKVTRWFGTNTNVDQVRRAREALQEETRVLELLNETGKTIGSQLDLQALVQQVTDAATKLSGAKFGAFFYNVINDQGESFLLYTLSGAPREAFEKFGLPRATPVFRPTFHGEGVVRVDDITQDPRYGKMAPHHGMPPGHLPVRSYLAVPVTSRSGEVIGGLFFGHPERGVFTEKSERLVVGVAAQAAVAIDNARLYQTAQREIEERRRIAEDLQKAREELSRHAQELEEQVATRTASLREAIAQLEEFSYSVSHDLRAPLRAIGGYNQILLKDYGEQVPEAAQVYLHKIARSTGRMERLVNDVLTMSRVARAEMKLHPIGLQEFVQEMVEQHPSMQPPAAEIKIEAPHQVIADDASLAQAVSNLLSNAVKFMPPGQRPVVLVRSERQGDQVRLWVEDNGIGIPEKHRDKLFGMFQRMPTKFQYEGTGIGLAIVRKAVERMEGTVGMEPNEPQGSRFWLQLKGAE